MGRPRGLARHVTLGHWTFFYRKQWLSRNPVENKYETHLRDLSHRGNFAAIPPHIDEHGLRRQIVIPDIVVHGLEVPNQFAGGRVQRDQTIGEQVLTFTVGAIKIVRG